MKQNEDIRGFDLKVEHFNTQLINLINSSNLPVSVIYYILKDTTDELNRLYKQTAEEQYQEFCEAAKQISEEEKQSSSEEIQGGKEDNDIK